MWSAVDCRTDKAENEGAIRWSFAKGVKNICGPTKFGAMHAKRVIFVERT